MKISETEKLNLSIIHGSRAYSQWEQDHDLPDYLVVIMYELLIRGKLTQRELVNLSDLPKQSINKGIKILRDHDHITMTVDPSDKRVRFCQLTKAGRKYAYDRLRPLFELEEKTAQAMGTDKMKLLAKLSEEWSTTFWHFLSEERSKNGKL
ncbi:MAG: MarR family winged helix-turn-helix transcriptional regulator [Lactobacillus crispatus]|jgi:DNA-binding MarR family transcriptional regulator|uniref:MarR family winged helix-turn-helix transcriptional regulator n=1 Tax=Lactobacillus crispatus TaxID=47770 RepID=UPI0018A9FEA7|nr:helix-turn-helix domain-containing protein [Lactobacillus crispatus]MCH4005229.1 MarR family winged helix-turn-helix transcriptional regulator [Lactobacillus crispatus]MCI1335055.1 MarR family winged helix-turn-helix transcriptional regulator [Lactobacillus crispatus]MCI1364471.1 MarR family winged helix-turn-helix transcriptional regulator [Lactobacillus crispatus]MCI1492942.1 MarR family winged helix-turn-helix transcriptional regulator [Lactobacillus crispatus]MCI1523541.1 MarR family wi